jgi:hypothetical protein
MDLSAFASTSHGRLDLVECLRSAAVVDREDAHALGRTRADGGWCPEPERDCATFLAEVVA